MFRVEGVEVVEGLEGLELGVVAFLVQPETTLGVTWVIASYKGYSNNVAYTPQTYL